MGVTHTAENGATIQIVLRLVWNLLQSFFLVEFAEEIRTFHRIVERAERHRDSSVNFWFNVRETSGSSQSLTTPDNFT